MECDTNIPSGESLIRQFVRGKRWFREELGVDSLMAWMPDTFGFSAALRAVFRMVSSTGQSQARSRWDCPKTV